MNGNLRHLPGTVCNKFCWPHNCQAPQRGTRGHCCAAAGTAAFGHSWHPWACKPCWWWAPKAVPQGLTSMPLGAHPNPQLSNTTQPRGHQRPSRENEESCALHPTNGSFFLSFLAKKCVHRLILSTHFPPISLRQYLRQTQDERVLASKDHSSCVRSGDERVLAKGRRVLFVV